MKFGQENKFFLGSSHHGVFSPSLIFSFGYTQPYPSLRSLVNPFILYPCTTSFILPSFILHPCSSSFIHPSFILAVHHSSIHPCNSPFILHLCSSSFIHASYFLPPHPSFIHPIQFSSLLHPHTFLFIHIYFILLFYYLSIKTSSIHLIHPLSLQLVILSHPIFSRYCLRTLYYR